MRHSVPVCKAHFESCVKQDFFFYVNQDSTKFISNTGLPRGFTGKVGLPWEVMGNVGLSPKVTGNVGLSLEVTGNMFDPVGVLRSSMVLVDPGGVTGATPDLMDLTNSL